MILNCLLIGAGRHLLGSILPAMLSNSAIKVVAICEPDRFRAARVLHHYPRAAVFQSFEDLDATVYDLAIISVPHHLHLSAVRAAASRCPIIVKEKPLTQNQAEAIKLRLVLQSFQTSLHLLLPRRYSRVHLNAARQIGTGNWSKIVIGYGIDAAVPNSDWRGRWGTAGGGVVLDMGYHILDAFFDHLSGMTLAAGELRKRFNSAYEVEDTARVEFRNAQSLMNVELTCIGPKREFIAAETHRADRGLRLYIDLMGEFRAQECIAKQLADIVGIKTSDTQNEIRLRRYEEVQNMIDSIYRICPSVSSSSI
jgi:predicted dehydrogenase